MSKANKKETSTLTYYNRWKATKTGLNIGKFVAPCVPATIITIVNWNEWFNKTSGGLPAGFATLLIAILITVYAYCNKDELAKKKISPFFFIGTIMAVFGVSFLLLANIMQTMGLTFIFTTIGIFGGGAMDQINKGVVENRVQEYKKLVDENCLDIKSQKKAERKEKAQREREEKAKQESQVQASE